MLGGCRKTREGHIEFVLLQKRAATLPVFCCAGPVKGELELCGLGDGLSVCEGAGHAAEDALVDFDHLVDGPGGHILPKEEDGEALRLVSSNLCNVVSSRQP